MIVQITIHTCKRHVACQPDEKHVELPSCLGNASNAPADQLLL